jgi:hypothetical protein
MSESWSYSHGHLRNRRRYRGFGVDNVSHAWDFEPKEPFGASQCACNLTRKMTPDKDAISSICAKCTWRNPGRRHGADAFVAGALIDARKR